MRIAVALVLPPPAPRWPRCRLLGMSSGFPFTILLTATAKHTSMYHQFFDALLFPLIRAAAERPNSTGA